MTNNNGGGHNGHNGHTGLDLVRSLWWADFRQWHDEARQRAEATQRHVRVAAFMVLVLFILLFTASGTPLLDAFLTFYYLFFLASMLKSRHRLRVLSLAQGLAPPPPARHVWLTHVIIDLLGPVVLGAVAVFTLWRFTDHLGRLLTWHP